MEILNSNLNIGFFHDTRRPNKKGESLVKIRITHNRKRKYINTGFSFTQKKFATIMDENSRGDNKKIRLVLEKKKDNIIEIINKIPEHDFSFDRFDLLYSGKGAKIDRKNFFSALNFKIDQLEKVNKMSSWYSYRGLKTALIDFVGKEQLPYTDITPNFLQEYEMYLKDLDRSVTTVGIHMRNIRVILNMALDEGCMFSYPFTGKKGYKIPLASGRNLALSVADIRRIHDYTPDNEHDAYYKDLWMFSYLCNGMNVKDIAALQYKNLNLGNNTITFFRKKTVNARNQKLIEVVLIPQSMQIIGDWQADNEQQPEDYIFPILSNDMNDKEKYFRVQSIIKEMNKTMGKIANELDLPIKPTTYSARHSFASIQKNSGAPTSFIQESLGHKSISTTEAYLKKFEIEQKRKFTRKLL